MNGRRAALAIALYAGATCALTWPLVLELDGLIPLGSEPSPTVPFFNLWTLGWNVSWLGGDGPGYWNAPIFHPLTGAFAFSDPQPLSGLLAAPLWALDRAAAYNAVLLLFTLFNGLAVFRLLRHRGMTLGPALAGGLLVQALPFLTHERGVLQLQPLFGVVLAVDQLWRLGERPAPRTAVLLGLAVAVTFLTSEYFGLFLIPLLAVEGTVLVDRLWSRRAGAALLLATAVAALLVLPVALPQARRLGRMEFSRSARTVLEHSARPADYLRTSDRLRSARLLGTEPGGRQPLSPGFVLLALAAAGAVTGLRESAAARRWCLFLLVAAALAFIGSLGLELQIGSWQPYATLRARLPGVADLRSPFRLAVLVQLSAALLATQLLQLLAHRGRPRALLLLTALALAGLWPQPERLTRIPSALPVSSFSGPAVFLPFAHGSGAAAYTDTAAVMCALLPARARLVNGYSGHFPGFNGQLKELLRDFPTPLGLTALRALGVQTLLLERGRLSGSQLRRLDEAVAEGLLLPRGEVLELSLFEVPGSRLEPARHFTGTWTLEARAGAGRLRLRARPRLPEDEVYVVAPEIAPLDWTLRLALRRGRPAEHRISPPGAFLLYTESRLLPRFEVEAPRGRGPLLVQLSETESGKPLAAARVELP